MLTCLAVLASCAVQAEFEVRENGLDRGYTDNLTVVPLDKDIEAAKLKFSYDVDEIEFNHQYKAAKHFINRLSLQERAKIDLFWHEALIEKALTPKTLTKGSVSLRSILQKSHHDTSLINTEQDLDVLVRHTYTQKLNKLVPVWVMEKNGNHFDLVVDNHTDFRIKKIYFNFRVVDQVSGRPYMDESVAESGLFVGAGKSGKFTINMPSRVEGWYNLKDNLAYKVTVTKVEFYGEAGQPLVKLIDGKTFDADRFYQGVKDSKEVLDPFPFTEFE